MKNRRGLQMDYLGWILIALAILVLGAIFIFSNKSAISGILSGIKF